MKRARPIVMLLLFILLCASLTYWGMLMSRSAPRMQAPAQQRPPANVSAAATLFGGSLTTAATSSNFQLTGVVNAKNDKDSAAIIAINGKPARPLRIGDEVSHGVTVHKVHEKYVLLSENGISRRLDLAERPKRPSNVQVSRSQPLPQQKQESTGFRKPNANAGK